jgi:hypothetical protein
VSEWFISLGGSCDIVILLRSDPRVFTNRGLYQLRGNCDIVILLRSDPRVLTILSSYDIPDAVTTQALNQWAVDNSFWVTPQTVSLNSLRLGNCTNYFTNDVVITEV